MEITATNSQVIIESTQGKDSLPKKYAQANFNGSLISISVFGETLVTISNHETVTNIASSSLSDLYGKLNTLLA